MYEILGSIIHSFISVVIASAFCILNIFDKLKEIILTHLKDTSDRCNIIEKYINENLYCLSHASRKRRSENPFLEYCLKEFKEILHDVKEDDIPKIKSDFENKNRHILGAFAYPQFLGCCLYFIVIIIICFICPAFFNTYNGRLICLLGITERITFASIGWVLIFLLPLSFVHSLRPLRDYYLGGKTYLLWVTILIVLFLWWQLNIHCNLKIIPNLLLFDFNKMVAYFILLLFPLAFFFVKCVKRCLKKKEEIRNRTRNLMFSSSSFPYFKV